MEQDKKILRTGVNTFNIDTIAQDGSKDTYTVMIYRELSDNNYLSSLSTIDGTFVENFDKETLEYHLEIESSVNKLNLNYEKEVDTSKVQILNNSNFKAGKNIVTLRVTAENGDVRDYKIIANRKLSTNNYLKSLSTNEGTIEPEFNKETTEYKIVVENEVSLIDVKAEREDILSTMIGDRKYSLQVGENQKQLEKTHLY